MPAELPPALLHSPGAYSALVRWSAAPGADRAAPLAGGSWVFTATFVKDIEGFSRLTAREQDRTIGRTREGEPLPDAPDGAHAREQDAVSRLVFVAAAKDPQSFADALDAFTGRAGAIDRLAAWARPVAASLFVAMPRGRA